MVSWRDLTQSMKLRLCSGEIINCSSDGLKSIFQSSWLLAQKPMASLIQPSLPWKITPSPSSQARGNDEPTASYAVRASMKRSFTPLA